MVLKLDDMREKLHLQPEEKFILYSADIHPDPSLLNAMDSLIPSIRDWEGFTKKAINRAASPLIVSKLGQMPNASLIPDHVLRSLKQASLRTLTRNMLLTEHFRQVIRAFTDAGIPVIALKGSMLSDWLYGDINLRQFSDLDLLVPQEKGLEALEILQGMGFSSSDLTMSDFVKANSLVVHYTPMIKNGVSVEIHIRLHSEAERYQVDLPGIWKRAIPIQMHGVTALGLCPEDLLLHLCFHLDKHFRSGEFQFTCLYDIVNMLNHKGDVIDWTLFEQTCLQAKAESVTFKYLLLSSKYLNGKIPPDFSKKYGFLLEPKDERVFLSILRGRGLKSYAVGLIKTMKHLNSFSKSVRYLFDVVFPSVEFMMRRYRLKSKSQLWLYYPYRMLSAIKSLWQTVKKAFS